MNILILVSQPFLSISKHSKWCITSIFSNFQFTMVLCTSPIAHSFLLLLLIFGPAKVDGIKGARRVLVANKLSIVEHRYFLCFSLGSISRWKARVGVKEQLGGTGNFLRQPPASICSRGCVSFHSWSACNLNPSSLPLLDFALCSIPLFTSKVRLNKTEHIILHCSSSCMQTHYIYTLCLRWCRQKRASAGECARRNIYANPTICFLRVWIADGKKVKSIKRNKTDHFLKQRRDWLECIEIWIFVWDTNLEKINECRRTENIYLQIKVTKKFPF